MTTRVTTTPRPTGDCVTRRLLVFPWAASKQRRRPAFIDVCRESRRVALLCGALPDLWLDVRHQVPRPVWFRFGVDIVFMPNLDENIYQLQPPLENPHHLARIRHLAVDWAFFHCGRWEPDSDEYRGPKLVCTSRSPPPAKDSPYALLSWLPDAHSHAAHVASSQAPGSKANAISMLLSGLNG
ncbi:hypothetical protein QBC33DRAFT_548619 [Phialemonium atrogriseum]|uniref:Uncharacterized protein n=1 Tax=Phialemonium atrogriseum TaxID=1093897 RepID=A0AAJ0FIX6_9PEZI|nr:uncharacterized protein QBC33DRAFT_548619 [Phialemonium atrogriseum]KAK1763784.1 hypothetical protein QBC33DRAFT_548619 [Phialemonium atrogriseum]